jgi:hypothetical protein
MWLHFTTVLSLSPPITIVTVGAFSGVIALIKFRRRALRARRAHPHPSVPLHGRGGRMSISFCERKKYSVGSVIGMLSIGTSSLSNRLRIPHEYFIVSWNIEYLSFLILEFVYHDGDTLSCAEKTEFGPSGWDESGNPSMNFFMREVDHVPLLDCHLSF